MDQLRDYADVRLVNGCIYCGGPEATREHTPSKVFLDSPYPENLPVVAACRPCNNGFSPDEEYVACLIESAIVGTTDPSKFERSTVSKILSRSPALRARIEKAKYFDGGRVSFGIEEARVRNVLLKLAKGHAVFELSMPFRDEPTTIWWSPLEQLPDQDQETFHSAHVTHLLGEVGSRGMQRQYVTQLRLQGENGEGTTMGLIVTDWVDVQEDVYRYLALHDTDGVKIRIVIREYLACEVTWCF
jgi:hypothetical protein